MAGWGQEGRVRGCSEGWTVERGALSDQFWSPLDERQAPAPAPGR